MLLLTILQNTFLPQGAPDHEAQPDEQIRARWRARYRAALLRLRKGGIEITADEQAGADAYIASERNGTIKLRTWPLPWVTAWKRLTLP
jgi:hypothetical protein